MYVSIVYLFLQVIPASVNSAAAMDASLQIGQLQLSSPPPPPAPQPPPPPSVRSTSATDVACGDSVCRVLLLQQNATSHSVALRIAASNHSGLNEFVEKYDRLSTRHVWSVSE